MHTPEFQDNKDRDGRIAAVDASQSDMMDNDYREVLQIATDALGLRYSVNFSALYWINDSNRYESKAALTFENNVPSKRINQSFLSQSLIGAIRRPLIISNTGQDKRFAALETEEQRADLRIVVPLFEQDRIAGVLDFWGKPETAAAGESERLLLDTIALVSTRVIRGFKERTLRLKDFSDETFGGIAAFSKKNSDKKASNAEHLLEISEVETEFPAARPDSEEEDLESETESGAEISERPEMAEVELAEEIESQADDSPLDDDFPEETTAETLEEDIELVVEDLEEETELQVADPILEEETREENWEVKTDDYEETSELSAETEKPKAPVEGFEATEDDVQEEVSILDEDAGEDDSEELTEIREELPTLREQPQEETDEVILDNETKIQVEPPLSDQEDSVECLEIETNIQNDLLESPEDTKEHTLPEDIRIQETPSEMLEEAEEEIKEEAEEEVPEEAPAPEDDFEKDDFEKDDFEKDDFEKDDFEKDDFEELAEIREDLPTLAEEPREEVLREEVKEQALPEEIEILEGPLELPEKTADMILDEGPSELHVKQLDGIAEEENGTPEKLLETATAVDAILQRCSESLDALLKYSGQDFLAFDKDCCIQNQFLPETGMFLDKSVEGTDALEILFNWGLASNSDSASFEKAPDLGTLRDLMGNVFLRVTDLDVLEEFLPTEIAMEDDTYKMEYQYLKSPRSADEDRILAVFTNISEEKKLTLQIKTELDRNSMTGKVALDMDGYSQFRNRAEQIFLAVADEMSKPRAGVHLEEVLHHIQSIQGGAEIYEMKDIAFLSGRIVNKLEDVLHKHIDLVENEFDTMVQEIMVLQDTFQFIHTQYLKNLVSDEQILDKTIYRVTDSKIAKIQKIIVGDVIQENIKKLEVVFERNYKPFTKLKGLEEITKKRLDRIKSYLRNSIIEPASKEAIELLESFRKQPVGLVMNRYAMTATGLANRLHKRVEVELKGVENEVSLHRYADLFNSLVYVVRNSVEHGLESMEERVFMGKPLDGKITVETSIEDDQLKIVLTDDGKGIDVEKIKKSAVEREVISETDADLASQQQILDLMFKKGFSQKQELHGTFGRGIGLNAVGSIVEELNGRIEIRTEHEAGTTLEVSVPLF